MKLLIEHIRKSYAGKTVLQDCTFAFPAGGVNVLMGPNGCGKSTLLRICALLEPPDGGMLQFMDNGAPLSPGMPLKRRMTLVLPRTGVFNTTVFNNVAYGLKIRGVRRAELESRALKALSFVGLDDKIRQQARTLSSGETQRMGIARALAFDPEVLFLDEPTASVDEENTGIIETAIQRMREAGRTTIIMTTHDRDQAERLADRMLILTKGVLTEQ